MPQPKTDQPDEFEAAFAEAAAARLGGQSIPQDATPKEEPKPGETEKPSEQPAETAEAKPVATPEEGEVAKLRRELEESRHRERSASARVSSFQKKLNALEAQLSQVQAPAPVSKPEPVEEDQELEAARSEMPEVAKLVDRLVDRKVSEAVQKVERTVEPLRDRVQKDDLRQEVSKIETEFPEWRKVVYTQEWEDWIEAKPAAIRRAYSEAQTADDALEFLRMYHREKGAPASQQATTEKPQRPSAQERLEKSVGIPSRGAAPVHTGLPSEDDFDGAFQHFAAQRRKQA